MRGSTGFLTIAEVARRKVARRDRCKCPSPRCENEAEWIVTRSGKRLRLCGYCTFPFDTNRVEL